MSYKRKKQIFRNYHIIFHVTLWYSGKLLYLCTQISEERRVKNLSHVFQSKATRGRQAENKRRMPFGARHIAKGTNSDFSLFTLDSSLSKQVRFNSVASPFQIPFRNGRMEGEEKVHQPWVGLTRNIETIDEMS